MINRMLIREKRLIDDLFDEITTSPTDQEAKSLLVFYLCIRVSGFVENCVKIVFHDYSSPRSKDRVENYVYNKLKRFPNPTFENIVQLAREFDEQWAENFKKVTTSQQRSSLGAVNLNRNAIAHGETSVITLAQLSQYFRDLVELIENLELNCQ